MTLLKQPSMDLNQELFGGALPIHTVLNTVLNKLEQHQQHDAEIDTEHFKQYEISPHVIECIQHHLANDQIPLMLCTKGIPADIVVFHLIASMASLDPVYLYLGQLKPSEWDQITKAIFQIQSTALFFNEKVDVSTSELDQQIMSILDMHHRPKEAMTIMHLKSNAIEQGRGEYRSMPS